MSVKRKDVEGKGRRGSTRRHYGTSGEFALSETEAATLLGAIWSTKDKALIHLAMATGIRREDIAAIPIAGLDLTGGWVSFYDAKKKRAWRASIGGPVIVSLRAWLPSRPRASQWLFPSDLNPARHTVGRTAYNRLQHWLKVAGLRSRPWHALRSTFIKLARAKGWTDEELMAQTGDTLRTLMRHYTTPTAEEMVKSAKERAPI